MLYSGISFAELKDPTTPTFYHSEKKIVNTPEQQESLKLSAIWVTGKNKRAIINGMTIKPGEKLFSDIELVKILKDSVLIKQNGETRRLYLLNQSYKTSNFKTQSR